MKTLHECLEQTTWSEVCKVLGRIYPDHVDFLTALADAYQELTATTPEINDIRITIGKFEPNSVLPFYIVGFRGECPKGYCLKFIPWSQWLGASVDPNLFNQYQIAEIVAICFYDMCWAGFSSNNVVSFRKEFSHHENCLWAIFGYEEQLESSEFNLIKRDQRLKEFNEALNLQDIDDVWGVGIDSPEYRQALFDMNVQIYCLGESETDYDEYCAKVARLKKDFQQKWSEPNARRPLLN